MDLKPVWWLDDYWGWDLLTKNLANVTNQMYTGRGEFQTFLTKSIENCLEIRGKDPETHVHDKSDKEKLRRKKINKVPTLGPLPPSATLVETLIEPNTPLSPQPQPSIFQYQPPEQPLEPELTVEMFNYSMQSRTIVDPPEHLSSQGGNLLKVVP